MPDEVVAWEGPEKVTLAEAASGRYPCITWNGKTASFWCSTEEDGVDVSLFILSRFPFPYPDEQWANEHPTYSAQHCIDLEAQEVGLHELMLGYSSDEFAVVNFLLASGLASGLPFRVVGTMHYESSYDSWSGGTEHDSFFEWDIVEVARLTEDGLTPEQAWLEWAKTIQNPPLATIGGV